MGQGREGVRARELWWKGLLAVALFALVASTTTDADASSVRLKKVKMVDGAVLASGTVRGSKATRIEGTLNPMGKGPGANSANPLPDRSFALRLLPPRAGTYKVTVRAGKARAGSRIKVTGRQLCDAPVPVKGCPADGDRLGGGGGLKSPLPAGTRYQIGGPYGYFWNENTHRSYGSNYNDDRYAMDINLVDGRGNGIGQGDRNTPIVAAQSGRVVVAGSQGGGYGRSVVINGGPGGYSTRYSHLQSIAVAPGTQVAMGQRIGTMGEDGCPGCGVHLHFAVYDGNGRSGIALPTFDGQRVADGAVLTSQNNGELTPLEAELQYQAFGETQMAPGSSQPVGFNIRFNERYDPAIVLAPDAATAQNVSSFLSVKGDWPGVAAPVADPRATDFNAAYYRADLSIPAGTPLGWYFFHWRTIDRRNGRAAALEPSFWVKVAEGGTPAASYPRPPSDSPPYAIQFVSQDFPKLLGPGETGTMKIKVRNWGTSFWDSSVRLATLDDSPIRNAVSGTLNGNRVPFTDEDGDGQVSPGEVATFTYQVNSATATAFRQRFGLIKEGTGPRFGNEAGLYIRTVIADETHFPPELTAADCTWAFVSQSGTPFSASRVEVNGASSSSWSFTIRNTSDICPWFPSGTNPMRLATRRPTDRGSGFADTSAGWISTTRVNVPSRALPGETLTIPMALKASAGISNGNYDEFMAPVIEGRFHLVDIGMFIPVRKVP